LSTEKKMDGIDKTSATAIAKNALLKDFFRYILSLRV